MNSSIRAKKPASAHTVLDNIERSGVVMQIGFDPLPCWEPQIQLVTAWLSRELTPDFSDTLRQRMTSGHGFERQRAVASAIGETIERVAGGIYYGKGQTEMISGLPLLDLQRLPRFSTSESNHLDDRYGQFSTDAPYTCHPVVELETKKRYRVPSQLVFCPYHPRPEENLFWEPTASGLAAGRSSTNAQVAGLMEVVERDALAVSWLLRIPGQELSLRETLGSDLGVVTHAIMRGPVEIRLARVSLDIPLPVCVAAICNKDSMPAIAFGAAAATRTREAAKKAIAEAALVYYTTKLRLNILNEPHFDPRTSDPGSYQEHGMAWTDPRFTAEALWFFGDRTSATLDLTADTPEATLHKILRTLRDLGYTAYSSDLTQLEPNGSGWNVARVLIPGLQPLNPGRHRRMLDSERLLRAQSWFRGTEQLLINDYIHPFC